LKKRPPQDKKRKAKITQSVTSSGVLLGVEEEDVLKEIEIDDLSSSSILRQPKQPLKPPGGSGQNKNKLPSVKDEAEEDGEDELTYSMTTFSESQPGAFQAFGQLSNRSQSKVEGVVPDRKQSLPGTAGSGQSQFMRIFTMPEKLSSYTGMNITREEEEEIPDEG
jgi:hypothetical protein